MNRLGNATSPYLAQHRDNPVDWWPWCEEAWEEARRRDVPVLLSVGYAACHWCHVMAHESFEDDATAEVVNAGFVAIKVDREERPDVDAVYMEATQALTGHGGWPMTVFCTPDGRPFHAGTYYPPVPRRGMPSFRQLLHAVLEAWRDRRGEVASTAERLSAALGAGMPAPAPGAPGLDAGALEDCVRAVAGEEDREAGGFGRPPTWAPKFPNLPTLLWLARHAGRAGAESGSGAVALAVAERALHALARSGTYDQLAGGTARYATDRHWVVPHFEKMLDDNALLARAAVHLHRLTGDPVARRLALETCDWLVTSMRTTEGGFATSLDADTEGVEGATSVWTPAQLVDVLGADDGAWVAELCGVTDVGTFEHGTSTLQLLRDLPPGSGDARRWAALRPRLLAARDARPQPGRDDKVVTAWNGLAVAALAEVGVVLDRPDLLAAAEAAGDLLVAVHLDEHGRLLRVSRDGRPGAAPAVLEDHADLAEGLLALHAATGDPAWAGVAGALLDDVLTRFADGLGGFYDTGADTTDARLAAVGRPRDVTDGVRPSGTAAAAGALLSWSALTGSARHRDAAEAALSGVADLARQAPRFTAWSLAVAEALVDGPREVAVVGRGAGADRLHRVAMSGTAPGMVVARQLPESALGAVAEDDVVPLLRDRPLLAGQPAAYVCRAFACDAPTSDVAALAHAVGARPGAVGEALGQAVAPAGGDAAAGGAATPSDPG